MKYDILTIRGAKAVIQCTTQLEADRLLKAVDFNHRYNYSSQIISQWIRDKENTCCLLNDAGVDGISIGKRSYFEDKGYDIIQCSDIITVAIIKVKQVVDAEQIEFAIELMKELGTTKITKTNVWKEVIALLTVWGTRGQEGLINKAEYDEHDNKQQLISNETIELSKKLFPDFYKP